jgi:hypothetical protein
MTDGAWSCTRNRSLREPLAAREVRQIVTPPSNGKVERSHQTMEREWLKGFATATPRPQRRTATLA